MARPPLLTLDDVSLDLGGAPLFSGLSLSVSAGERFCLVGRNGAGKSTLLKLIAGMIEPDSGTRFAQPGARIAYLPQEPDFTGFATLGDYAAADLEDHERYKAEMAMEGLQVMAEAAPGAASGGERRRAALARCLAGAPDLMLLDEPTNHLDINAIEWLETELAGSEAGFILISHDRRFLTKLSRATIWLDRGECRQISRGFDGFEDWRDKLLEEERAERHKLDRLIKAEARWAVEGISARRTRNMGRVRRLGELRAARAGQIAETGRAAMALSSGAASGKLVIEAKGIAKRYGERVILSPFSTRIARGDRVALIGPNGAGKTTLLNMLTGTLAPDEGTVRLGSNLEIARFDQNRDALDPKKSLWETLTDDKVRGPKARSDQIIVRGRPQHVVGYLKSFLFDESQARGPVSALSGGERARLLLAKIMARESNLLVLDEPTNDLDIETLDLLQELLADYDGTALIVSHDRDFIDRVATSVIAVEGNGSAVEYAGGWSDSRAQRSASGLEREARPRAKAGATPSPARPTPSAPKFGFRESHRLATLPGEMERLAAEIAKLEAFLSDPALYVSEPKKFAKASEALTERQAALGAAEEEWLELEEMREAAEGRR
ncbi:ABC-F family ATP-binding cassette domain-containing protein [Pikeienuella piscinae]|uniref:ABC-F family ATP-binding cassette domain-containing protein n=1 Tax=Pikeienuella piscinae TaxID=2748098 RepID=A0A7L5BSS7_9RHOB|nr:ABC-F family ATP-binding cassette domain-containing protein [Pikeienuella piscinae]QIE54032.1 ABC-F family ATP-binding cassette domain-containing protein [Pikeienuella piscinae]